MIVEFFRSLSLTSRSAGAFSAATKTMRFQRRGEISLPKIAKAAGPPTTTVEVRQFDFDHGSGSFEIST